MMRAAIAEIGARGYATAYATAGRAYSDSHGCDDPRWCRTCELHRPSRSELVSARRALHALAASGLADEQIKHYRHGTPVLAAVSVAMAADLRLGATHKPLAPCFHCGRPLGDAGGGSGMNDGMMICRQCMTGTTNALALIGGAS